VTLRLANSCAKPLGGMRKLRRNIVSQIDSTRLEDMHKLV